MSKHHRNVWIQILCYCNIFHLCFCSYLIFTSSQQQQKVLSYVQTTVFHLTGFWATQTTLHFALQTVKNLAPNVDPGEIKGTITLGNILTLWGVELLPIILHSLLPKQSQITTIHFTHALVFSNQVESQVFQRLFCICFYTLFSWTFISDECVPFRVEAYRSGAEAEVEIIWVDTVGRVQDSIVNINTHIHTQFIPHHRLPYDQPIGTDL